MKVLPDLQPIKGAFPPSYHLLYDCQVVKNDPDIEDNFDNVTLRFSNGVANMGRGRLELIRGAEKILDNGDKIAQAKQRIYEEGDKTFTEKDVGTFEYHREGHHDHWHYENFASFELLNEEQDLVVKSAKQAFCLVDVLRITSKFGGPSNSYYLEEVCEESPISGISVGWADIYTANLPGQYIEITDIPDGIYWIRSIANPDGVLETLNGKTFTQLKVEINKNIPRPRILST